MRAFRIGWAPDEWRALVQALKLPDDVIRDTGLGYLNRNDRQTDAFRGRILFPIFDGQGDPVALGGRVLPGGEGPKYRNSSETPIYAKSRVLYGLNWAKAAISRYWASSSLIEPATFFIALVCAAEPTRLTDRPTLIAGRTPWKNSSVSRKIWPSVIEMTLVGM